MITEHRQEAKELAQRILDLLKERSNEGDMVEAWHTRIKDHEITSIVSEIKRILRWSSDDDSLEIDILKSIKTMIDNANSPFIESSWREIQDLDLFTTIIMIEKICLNNSDSTTQDSLALS